MPGTATDGEPGVHRRSRVADVRDRDARVGVVVAHRVRGRRLVERPVAGTAGKRVTVVAAVDGVLEVLVTVGLLETDLVVSLVAVRGDIVVDVVDEQPLAGQFAVVAVLLAVLDEEVLAARRAVLPQPVDLVAVLHVRDGHVRVRGVVHDVGPPLVRLAPGRGVRRDVAGLCGDAPVPRPTGHETPVAQPFRGTVGVVEVGPAEQQVPEFVTADPDAAVFGDGEVGVDLRRVRRVRTTAENPLVRPDVVRAQCLLCALPRVDDDEGVDEAVTVVVVRSEVDVRICGHRRVPGHRPRVRCRAPDTGRPVRVGCERLREPVRPDDLTDDVDLVVRRLREVLLDAPVGERAGREEQFLVVGRRLGHLLVGEVHEHDDDPHRPSQGRAIGGGAPDEVRWRSRREVVPGDDETVVEPDPCRLFHVEEGGEAVRGVALPSRGVLPCAIEFVLELFSGLGARRHQTAGAVCRGLRCTPDGLVVREHRRRFV